MCKTNKQQPGPLNNQNKGHGYSEEQNKHKFISFLQVVIKFGVDRGEQAEEIFFSIVGCTHQLWSGRREAAQRKGEV